MCSVFSVQLGARNSKPRTPRRTPRKRTPQNNLLEQLRKSKRAHQLAKREVLDGLDSTSPPHAIYNLAIFRRTLPPSSSSNPVPSKLVVPGSGTVVCVVPRWIPPL